MIPALAAAAWAHPLGAGFSTETLVLHVEPGALRVEYAAEVDTALLAPRGNGRAPVEDLAVELESGLQLRIDDVPVPLPPAARALDPGRSAHTVGVDLSFAVPLPPGAGRVRVATGNLLDARVLRATDVRVSPRIRVRSASILPERDGRPIRDDGLRWSQDEARRAAEVTFRTEPALWSTLARRGTDAVRAPAALDPRGLGRLAPAAAEPVAALGWLVAALASRLAADPPARSRGLAVAVGFAAALSVPTSGVAEGVAAVALLAAAALPRGPTAALALSALLGTLHPWPLTLLGALVLLAPLPPPTSPRPRVAALVVAAALAVRAIAARA